MLQNILDAITPPPQYENEAFWALTFVLTLLSVGVILKLPYWIYFLYAKASQKIVWCLLRLLQGVCTVGLFVTVGFVLRIRSILRIVLLVWYVGNIPYQYMQGTLYLRELLSHDTRIRVQFSVLPVALQPVWQALKPQRQTLVEVWADVLVDSVRGWKLPEIQGLLARIESLGNAHTDEGQRALIALVYNRVGSCDTLARADWAGLDRVKDSLCPSK
jgi:hypothetical protein